MTDLVVRRLLIDLQTPFPWRCNGGDGFRSAVFNAFSLSFLAGQQFFSDAVRAGLKALPEEKRAVMATELQCFIGQEATHRLIHALFSGQRDRLGYDNEIERRANQRRHAHAGRDLSRQAVRNTWHDGSLFHWRSWRSAATMMFGRDGLIRGNYGLWKAYFAPDFHPSQQSASLSQRWLRDNAGQFGVVGHNF